MHVFAILNSAFFAIFLKKSNKDDFSLKQHANTRFLATVISHLGVTQQSQAISLKNCQKFNFLIKKSSKNHEKSTFLAFFRIFPGVPREIEKSRFFGRLLHTPKIAFFSRSYPENGVFGHFWPKIDFLRIFSIFGQKMMKNQ